MQIVIDDLLVEYTRQGKGPVVLVLHGWADQAMNWQHFATTLSSEYDVIVPSLPGFGGSQSPSGVWGLDEYAHCIAKLLEKLSVKPDIIIGHSNGGAVAIRALATGVIQTSKLVLLASAGVRDTDKGKKAILKYIAKTGKLATRPLPASVRRTLRSKLYTTIGSDLLVAEHMQETFKRVVAQDVVEDARMVTVPTLLLYGQHDTDAPVAYGQLFHEQIKGSVLKVIDGAGHFLYRDNEQMVVRQILEFLA